MMQNATSNDFLIDSFDCWSSFETNMSTWEILLGPDLALKEEDFWSLVGRDELHIEKAPAGGLFSNFLTKLLAI